MWQLEYMVNGEIKELIANNLAFGTARWQKKQLELSGNYKYGLIILSKMK